MRHVVNLRHDDPFTFQSDEQRNAHWRVIREIEESAYQRGVRYVVMPKRGRITLADGRTFEPGQDLPSDVTGATKVKRPDYSTPGEPNLLWHLVRKGHIIDTKYRPPEPPRAA